MNILVHSPGRVAVDLLALTMVSCSANAQQSGPPPAPTCDSVPGYHDLDFWLGEWDVFVGATVVGCDQVERILSGCAITERWRSARRDEGHSLFYHDPAAGTWTQVWITDRSTTPGGLKVKHIVRPSEDGSVRFQGTVTPTGGQPYLDRTTLRPLRDGTVHQTIEISRDSGRTWEVRFDAIYRRPDGRTSGSKAIPHRAAFHALTRSGSSAGQGWRSNSESTSARLAAEYQSSA